MSSGLSGIGKLRQTFTEEFQGQTYEINCRELTVKVTQTGNDVLIKNECSIVWRGFNGLSSKKIDHAIRNKNKRLQVIFINFSNDRCEIEVLYKPRWKIELHPKTAEHEVQPWHASLEQQKAAMYDACWMDEEAIRWQLSRLGNYRNKFRINEILENFCVDKSKKQLFIAAEGNYGVESLREYFFSYMSNLHSTQPFPIYIHVGEEENVKHVDLIERTLAKFGLLEHKKELQQRPTLWFIECGQKFDELSLNIDQWPHAKLLICVPRHNTYGISDINFFNIPVDECELFIADTVKSNESLLINEITKKHPKITAEKFLEYLPRMGIRGIDASAGKIKMALTMLSEIDIEAIDKLPNYSVICQWIVNRLLQNVSERDYKNNLATMCAFGRLTRTLLINDYHISKKQMDTLVTENEKLLQNAAKELINYLSSDAYIPLRKILGMQCIEGNYTFTFPLVLNFLQNSDSNSELKKCLKDYLPFNSLKNIRAALERQISLDNVINEAFTNDLSSKIKKFLDDKTLRVLLISAPKCVPLSAHMRLVAQRLYDNFSVNQYLPLLLELKGTKKQLWEYDSDQARFLHNKLVWIALNYQNLDRHYNLYGVNQLYEQDQKLIITIDVENKPAEARQIFNLFSPDEPKKLQELNILTD